ncbi:E3 ubiquitin-protein ligase TRIM71-like [Glandiceps talaboti]
MSAVHKEVSDTKENWLITCVLCMKMVQHGKLRMLPCLHGCCESCLKTNMKSGELYCQKCSQKFQTESEDLKPFFIADIVQEMTLARRKSGKYKCETCVVKLPSMSCTDCKCHICEKCSRTSHSQHHVQTFSGTFEECVSVPKAMCLYHEEDPVKLFCRTCGVPICLTCTYVQHTKPEHDFIDLKDAAKEFSETLKVKLDDLKDVQQKVKQSKLITEEMSNVYAKKYQQTRDTIQKHTQATLEKLRQEIKSKEKELLNDLEENYKDAKCQLSEEVNQLKKKDEHVMFTQKVVTMLLNHGTKDHMMLPYKEILAQTDEFSQYERKQGSKLHDFASFTADDIELQGCLGYLQGGLVTPKSKSTTVGSQLRLPKSIRVGEELQVPIVKVMGKREEAISAVLRNPHDQIRKLEVVKISSDKTGDIHGVKVIGTSSGLHKLAIKVDDSPLNFDLQLCPWRLTRAFCRQGSTLGELDLPYGATVNENGDIAVADHRNHRVQLFKASKSGDGTTAENVELKEQFFPRDVAYDDDMYLVSVDAGALNKGKVVVRNEKGSKRSSFGTKELKVPCGIALNKSKGMVYVVDSRTHCINIYSRSTFDLISDFGSMGSDRGEFDHPEFVAVDSHGRVIVSDYYNKRLQLFDSNGKPIAEISNGRRGIQLSNPRGVAVDVYDNIYTCDSDLKNVQKFAPDGRLVCRIDSDDDNLVRPIGIAVTHDTPCKVVVTDNGTSCINVFS